MAKCSETGQNPEKTLYEWRNIPRTDGFSPAQLLFGRKQFSAVPAMPHHFNFYDRETAEKAKDNTFASSAKYHDAHKGFLSQLEPGENVIVQDPKTHLWDKKGIIISVRPDKLSYNVECDGREFLRSRKMLSLIHI